MHTFPPAMKVQMCAMFLPRESTGFIGGWSYGPPLPSMYQHSRLPGGKWAFLSWFSISYNFPQSVHSLHL